MSMLGSLDQDQGFVKAGFLGNAGSGKTYTSALLAIGTRKHFKLNGPIAMFDTEGGSAYIKDMVKRETGLQLLGKRSRALSDLMTMGQECLSAKVSVLIVDSMSHLWSEVCAAFLKQVNEARDKENRGPLAKLEFQHWATIKAKFATWTDFYLNSPLHIVVAGRLGYDYAFEEDDNGKKELIKTGVKMKTEGEFGYEPSLLVQMESIQDKSIGKLTGTITRRATILKDRFNEIDGKQFENPTFETFLPHVGRLSASGHTVVDTEVKTPMKVDGAGDAEWQRERRNRAILCEEIQGEMVKRWPGQTAEEKKAKLEAIERLFGTRSWTKVESTDSEKLRVGLEALKAEGAVTV